MKLASSLGTVWPARLLDVLSELRVGPIMSHQPSSSEIQELDEASIMGTLRQHYHEKVWSSPLPRKLATYLELFGTALPQQDGWDMQEYLRSPLTVASKATLARFRLGSHALPVETGRYMGIPRMERSCEFCHLIGSNGVRALGDEVHVVEVCPHFQQQRDELHYTLNIPAGQHVTIQQLFEAAEHVVEVDEAGFENQCGFSALAKFIRAMQIDC